jgi:hypothetical protein
MRVFNTKAYVKWLQRHYEDHFDIEGNRMLPGPGTNYLLHRDFYVLEIPPNNRHNMFAYCTVGMSADRLDENLTELFVYSPVANPALVDLMAHCAHYHRNRLPVRTHNTIGIGRPWLENSKCDHGFISIPWLDGRRLELFDFDGYAIRVNWFIPITKDERNYRLKYGCEALEQLFEQKKIDYLNPARKCLVSEP